MSIFYTVIERGLNFTKTIEIHLILLPNDILKIGMGVFLDKSEDNDDGTPHTKQYKDHDKNIYEKDDESFRNPKS